MAFHAIHNLARSGLGTATLRYLQLGFGRTASAGAGRPTPRNLLGFKDGTDNLVPADAGAMERFVWVDAATDQPWMHGGTYLVARRIRIHLEAWDRSTLGDQERTIGRVKASGAPLGGAHERDPVDLDGQGHYGQPGIPESAHIRAAAPVTNHGQPSCGGATASRTASTRHRRTRRRALLHLLPKGPMRPVHPHPDADWPARTPSPTYLLPHRQRRFRLPTGPGPGRPWGQACSEPALPWRIGRAITSPHWPKVTARWPRSEPFTARRR